MFKGKRDSNTFYVSNERIATITCLFRALPISRQSLLFKDSKPCVRDQAGSALVRRESSLLFKESIYLDINKCEILRWNKGA